MRSIPQNILKLGYTIILDKVNKSHNVNLLKMIAYNKYLVWKYIYAQLPHQEKIEPSASNPTEEWLGSLGDNKPQKYYKNSKCSV